ncbi:MAG: alanine racemase, partial [Pseudomonadota bacterium]
MSRNTTATIDLNALAHNLDRVRAMAGPAQLMAVIKADAYGHGLKRCLSVLTQADALAVATLREAETIRRLNRDVPVILLEGVSQADELNRVAELKLDMVVHHHAQLDWIERFDLPLNERLWLKINTGMHRLGFA